MIFDRGFSCRQYKRSFWTPASNQQRSERLLQHILTTGLVCPLALLEKNHNPDDAWKKNMPLRTKQGPLLFNFKWLSKPNLVAPRLGAIALTHSHGDICSHKKDYPLDTTGNNSFSLSIEASKIGSSGTGSKKRKVSGMTEGSVESS